MLAQLHRRETCLKWKTTINVVLIIHVIAMLSLSAAVQDYCIKNRSVTATC